MSKSTVGLLVVLAVCGVLAILASRLVDFASKGGFSEPASPSAENLPVKKANGGVIAVFGKDWASRASDHQIQIYRVKQPRCPFAEIGEIRATVLRANNEVDVRKALREKLEDLARSIGGDAIAAVDQSVETSVAGGTGVPASGTEYLTWNAVVLRFTDDNCRD